MIPDTLTFSGIRNIGTAWLVAERELASISEGLLTGSVKLNRSAWNVTPGDVFKLTSGKHNVDSVIMRAANVDYGRPGDSEITVNIVEDVFGRRKPNFERPPQGGVSTAPRNFSIVGEDVSARFRWDGPQDTGGSSILYFEYSQNSGAWVQIPASADGTYLVSDLSNGTMYVFRLRAVNKVGPGRPTPPTGVTVSADEATGPGGVRDYGAKIIDSDVEAFWDVPASDGGASIIGYEYDVDDDTTIVTTAVPPPIVSYQPVFVPASLPVQAVVPPPTGNTGPTMPLPSDQDAYAFDRVTFWLNHVGRTLTWSNRTANHAGDPRNTQLTAALGLAELAATRAAFDAWSEIVNVTFEEVPDAADVNIRVGFGTYPIAGVNPIGWAARSNASQGVIVYGETRITPYLERTPDHEVGHILGLLHPDDRGGGDYVDTIMETLNHSFKRASTIQLGDRIGAMHVWGAVDGAEIIAPDNPHTVQGLPGSGTATLAWSVPVIDGGAAIEGYRVYEAMKESFRNSSVGVIGRYSRCGRGYQQPHVGGT